MRQRDMTTSHAVDEPAVIVSTKNAYFPRLPYTTELHPPGIAAKGIGISNKQRVPLFDRPRSRGSIMV